MFSSQTEKEVKKLWEEKKIPSQVREKESDNHYYFIDGPPYASGKIHLGTAMNRILKDIIIRYKRQKGFKVLDIPGFDCHGVPVEIKVQKKHDLKSKEDIEKFGVENFIEECRNFATAHIGDMSKEIYDLGQWMDWKNPYRTLDQKYMQSAWWTFKKAVDKGLLYHGQFPVHVCSECETSVSFNEIEHKDLTDTSIFVPLQSEDDDNKYYVIWTTTPWTLPSNMAIMVHPKYEYSEIKYQGKTYVIAKDLVETLTKQFGWEDYEVSNTYTGDSLVGKRYKPILGEWIEISDEVKEQAYKIVPSARFVHLEGGTGLVHCAPGHGKEDYQVGKEQGVPAFSPVTMAGEYDEHVPKFKGEKVKKLDPHIIEYLESKSKLLHKEKIKHSYPTCWRCHSPLLQVSLPQWFLSVEPLKKRLIELNKEEVSWFPTWGKDRFNNWLETLSDWPISRARFWGIPIPIWKCDKCGKTHVFGSLKELKEKAPEIDLNMDIHKPYIDDVLITCDCGEKVKRIPEIFDVWFDSGVASWASLGYPFNKELYDKYWPPGMNIEGSDQIRGWWNSQLITSTIAFDKAPFKHIALHGMILDVSKRKLSKSEGNDKPLLDRFSERSIDHYRYYFGKEYDGTDLIMDESKFKVVNRVFSLLENIFNFISLSHENPEFVTTLNLGQDKLPIEDKWILSKFNTLLKDSYKNYDTTAFSKLVSDVEKFILEDFSRVYIKLLRKRNDDKQVLSYVYSNVLLLLSPIIPHFTESMYQKFSKQKDSVHLENLPQVNESLINNDLEKNFDLSQEIVATSLALREEEKKRLRWLLPRMVVCLKESNRLENLKGIMQDMANIETIELTENKPQGDFASKECMEGVLVYLDKDVSEKYQNIWEVSELKRMIQSERKKNKFNPNDNVTLKISSDSKDFLENNKQDIESSTNTTLEIVDSLDKEKKKLIEREVSFSF